MDLDRIQRALARASSGNASSAATDSAPEAAPAAAPAAPAVDLNRIQAALAKASNPIQADVDAGARKQAAVASKATNAALKAGVPTPSQPVFDPPATGLKDYLYQYSSGRLELANLDDPRLDGRAAQALVTWALENPVQSSVARATPEGRERLSNHFRAIVALQDSPPTPSERTDAWDPLIREWQSAKFSPARGALQGAGGETYITSDLPKDFNPASIPPDAARRVLAKARFGNKDALNIMERGILNALGGDRFLKFIDENEGRSLTDLRYSRLTGIPAAGRPQREFTWDRDATVATDGADSAPGYHLGRVLGISPFANGLAQLGTRVAAENAQYTVARNQILGGSGVARAVDYIRDAEYKAEPARFGRLLFVELPAAVLTYGTLGLAPKLFQKAGEWTESGISAAQAGLLRAGKLLGGPALDNALEYQANHASLKRDWQLMLSSLGRRAANNRGDKAELLQDVFDAFPNATLDERAELGTRVFNAESFVRDTLKNASLLDPIGITKLFGFENPAVQEELGKIGSALTNAEDAGAFFVGLGMLGIGAKAARSHLEARNVRVKGFNPNVGKITDFLGRRVETLTKEEIAAIDAAPPAISVAQHAVLTDALFTQLRTVDDPQLAVAIAGRVADKLAEIPGMDAETLGAAWSAIETIRQQVREHGGANGLTREAQGALYLLGRPISHMNFFDQAFTLLGDADRARSAALVAKAENYMRVQAASADALPTHVPSITRVEAHTKALMLQAERERLFSDRVTRLDDISSKLDTQLAAEDAGFQAQIQRVDGLAEHLSAEWRKMISEEVDRFEQLEIGGGTIPQAKPVVRTDLFKKIDTVLQTRDPSQLWSLANDQRVVEAIQTPEWRSMWDALRGELDTIRRRTTGETPDIVNQRTILERTRSSLDEARGETVALADTVKVLEDELSTAKKALKDQQKRAAEDEFVADWGPAEGLADAADETVALSPQAESYSAAVLSLDQAKRQVKALEGAKEKGIVKERQTQLAFWKARVTSLEKTVDDLKKDLAVPGETKVDPLLDLKLRLRAAKRARSQAERRYTDLVEQERLSSEALDAAQTDVPTSRSQAEVEADMANTFGERLEAWYKDAVTPDEVTVAPATKPRTALIESLRQKLETLDPRDALVLTAEELDALNTYRTSKLKSPNNTAATALRKTSEALRKQREETAALRQKLADFRARLAEAKPDGPKLELDAATSAALARKLEVLDPETRGTLLNGDGTPQARSALASEVVNPSYVSLLPELNGDALTASQAWKEALADLRDQHQLILSGVLPRSSFEIAAMSQAGLMGRIRAAAILREASANAAGYQNLARLETAQWLEQLGRRLTPAERQQLMRDIATGKPTNDVSIQIMQRMRRKQLDQLLKTGAISPEFYHSLLRQDYYHGVFDRATRAQLAQAQARGGGPLGRLPARFTRMLDDPSHFKFKIPEEEGGFWAAWKDENGAVQHKVGFKSADEASAFLDSLPDSVREANVYQNWSFDKKLSEGLIGDVGVSHANLMEALGRQVAVHQLAGVIAHSGKIRPAGAFPSAVGNLFVDPDGRRWHRLDATKVPGLAGKWMEESGIVWLQEATNGWNFLGDIARLGISEVPVDARLGSPLAAALGKAGEATATSIQIARNALAISKIALGTRAWVQGWTTNLFQSWLAGIPFTPKGMAARLRLMRDYVRQSLGKTDSYYNDLVKAGSILPDDSKAILSTKEGFAHVLEDAEGAWNSAEGLVARIKHLEDMVVDAERRGDTATAAQAQAERASLENKLGESTRTLHKGLAQKVLGKVQSTLSEVGRTLTGSRKSKAGPLLWHIYQEGTLDNATKYIVYRYLVEEKGLARADALAQTQALLQHLHRVPQSIKNMVNRFGGAQFVTFPVEQARVLANLVRFYPEKAAGLMGFTFAWNLGALASQGVDPDTFYNGYANSQNVRRSPITDFQAMLRGFVVPFTSDTHRGLYQMGLGPLLWDFLAPGSVAGRQLDEVFTGREPGAPGNAVTTGLVSGAIGVGTKFAFGDTAFSTVASLIKGEDTFGNPIKDPMDVARLLYQTLTPDWAPGNRDSQQVGRILRGESRDPRTHREVGLLEYAARRLLSVQRIASEDQSLSAAISTQMHLSKRSASYTKSKSFDDLLPTQIARGAYDSNGKLNPAKALAVGQEYYARPENQPQMVNLEDDAPIDKVLSQAYIQARVKDASVPTLLNRFNSLAVDDMVSAYSLFRASYPNASKQTTDLLESYINKKLSSYSGSAKDSLQSLSAWIDANIEAKGVSPELKEKLERWRRRAKTLPVQSLILR